MITKINLWTACVTPFNDDGSQIDYDSLNALIKRQEQAANGIIVLGSTGEAISLKDHERKEIVKFVCALELKVPLMVGVPSHNLYQALEWLDFCHDLPIDGYLMTTPIYTKPGIIGQTLWFETLLKAGQKPSMLYNIPSRAGVKLHAETVHNLQNNEYFVAIKDSSGHLENLVEYKTIAPQIHIFCGDDHMMPAMASEGASGLISVASNIWPDATKRYVQRCLAGNPMVSKEWWHAVQALFATSNPIPIKAILHEAGIIKHDTVRLPLCIKDLTPRHKQNLIEIHKIMADWGKIT